MRDRVYSKFNIMNNKYNNKKKIHRISADSANNALVLLQCKLQYRRTYVSYTHTNILNILTVELNTEM